MSDGAAIGQHLDTLGIRADVDSTDLISSAVVVLSILVEGDPNSAPPDSDDE